MGELDIKRKKYAFWKLKKETECVLLTEIKFDFFICSNFPTILQNNFYLLAKYKASSHSRSSNPEKVFWKDILSQMSSDRKKKSKLP